jgi:hypothetical protein
MIERITVWKTADGQVFESYSKAEAHDKTLNRYAYVSRMKELAEVQRMDKRKLAEMGLSVRYNSSLQWVASNLQRKIKKQANELRRMLGELK